jgi:hypothetical protein
MRCSVGFYDALVRVFCCCSPPGHWADTGTLLVTPFGGRKVFAEPITPGCCNPATQILLVL